MKFAILGSSSPYSLYNTEYKRAAEELIKFISKRPNSEIIYGGNITGLMKIVRDESYKRKVELTAVLTPELLANAYQIYAKMEFVQTVEKRKEYFVQNADCFFFLPGGIGTLDELVYCIEHTNKKIILINSNGFYDGFYEFISRAMDEGFLDKKNIILLNGKSKSKKSVRISDVIEDEKNENSGQEIEKDEDHPNIYSKFYNENNNPGIIPGIYVGGSHKPESLSNKKYVEACIRTAHNIAALYDEEKNGEVLVGAYYTGLIGLASRILYDKLAYVIVVGTANKSYNLLNMNYRDKIIVNTREECKIIIGARAKEMYFLPGGSETLEEIVECIKSGRKFFLVNIEKYYQKFYSFLERMIKEKLAPDFFEEVNVGNAIISNNGSLLVNEKLELETGIKSNQELDEKTTENDEDADKKSDGRTNSCGKEADEDTDKKSDEETNSGRKEENEDGSEDEEENEAPYFDDSLDEEIPLKENSMYIPSKEHFPGQRLSMYIHPTGNSEIGNLNKAGNLLNQLIDLYIRQEYNKERGPTQRAKKSTNGTQIDYNKALKNLKLRNYPSLLQNSTKDEQEFIKGRGEKVPIAVYFDISFSMYKFSKEIITLAMRLLKSGVSTVYIGDNEMLAYEITSISSNFSIQDFDNIISEHLSISAIYSRYGQTDIRLHEISRKLDEYMKEAGMERLIVFSDLDAESSIINLSKDCKIDWFYLGKMPTNLERIYSGYKGKIYYSGNLEKLNTNLEKAIINENERGFIIF